MGVFQYISDTLYIVGGDYKRVKGGTELHD